MLYTIVAVLVIILDQWVKYWVAGNIAVGTGMKEFIPGILSLVNVHNDGAAFSFLSGSGARIYFIIICGVFTVGVIIALATKLISGPVGRWSSIFVVAGGLSNCIDRILYGYVQDMFKVELFDFAVFNVADIFITVFCLVFILYVLFGGDKKPGYDDEEAQYDEDDESQDEKPLFKRRKDSGYDEDSRGQAAAHHDDRRNAPRKAPEAAPRRKSKYEEEYEQYKAARAARPQTQPRRPEPKMDPADPFAEWERANARVEAEKSASAAAASGRPVQRPAAPMREPAPYQPAQRPVYTEQRPAAPVQPVRPAAPVQQPRPAAQTPVYTPAQPARPASADEFDLDSILNEFK